MVSGRHCSRISLGRAPISEASCPEGHVFYFHKGGFPTQQDEILWALLRLRGQVFREGFEEEMVN